MRLWCRKHLGGRLWKSPTIRFFVGGTEFYFSFEKSCLSHKLFVALSSVAVSRQKGKSRVNKCFM